jgi:hypothetical protein
LAVLWHILCRPWERVDAPQGQRANLMVRTPAAIKAGARLSVVRPYPLTARPIAGSSR